ncbi:MAG: ABC transporter substrate-binding protein [Chloroflexi bacterium]|nr:ABC transporter substrate-binding protein [Chloroflexota bacterium]
MAAATVTPTRGGNLISATTAGIPNANPYPNSPATNRYRNALFDPLVSLDPQVQPLPELAESWTRSDDGSTLIFKLRRGIMFHSGRPFTADAARWNIEFAQDPSSLAQSGPSLKGVQARAIDAGTLQITLPDVMPQIFALLADVLMIDPQSNPVTDGIGTGPFMLDGLRPDDEMRLMRNPRYWRADRPFLDIVSIKNAPDIQAGLVALESGAISLTQCPTNDVQRLQTTSGTNATVLLGSGNYHVLIDTADGPLSDQRVRQALSLALDRKRLTETIFHGLVVPTYIMWPRTSPVWNADDDTGEFNLDRARELLATAGYAGGFAMKLQGSTAYSDVNEFAQIVQADLATIGVSATIDILEAAEATAITQQGKFTDVFLLPYTFGDADPALLFTAPPFRTTGNSTRFQSDQYKQMVDSAQREADFAKRIAMYRQIAVFVKNQAFELPLAPGFGAFAHRSNLHGITRAPFTSVPLLRDIWMADASA